MKELDFYKNELIDKVLDVNYHSFEKTLDTCDFVPEKYNDWIRKYIFKNMKGQFKQVNKLNKKHIKDKKKLILSNKKPNKFLDWLKSCFKQKRKSSNYKLKNYMHYKRIPLCSKLHK